MRFDIPLDKSFKLKIAEHEINVEIVEKTHPVIEHKGDEYTYGSWDIDKRTIFIRSDVPYPTKLSVLLHEVYHVFEDMYQIKINHKDLNLSADLFMQLLVGNFKEPEKKNKSSK